MRVDKVTLSVTFTRTGAENFLRYAVGVFIGFTVGVVALLESGRCF
jgi:hypothetical protein